MAPLGQPHVPALIEIRFCAQLAHRVGQLRGEVALVADLEQLDLPHHTLPSISVRRRVNSSAPGGSGTIFSGAAPVERLGMSALAAPVMNRVTPGPWDW